MLSLACTLIILIFNLQHFTQIWQNIIMADIFSWECLYTTIRQHEYFDCIITWIYNLSSSGTAPAWVGFNQSTSNSSLSNLNLSSCVLSLQITRILWTLQLHQVWWMHTVLSGLVDALPSSSGFPGLSDSFECFLSSCILSLQITRILWILQLHMVDSCSPIRLDGCSP